jgi:hypothetical protein
MIRMVRPFSFSDIMREPIGPPAKENSAASKTNFKLGQIYPPQAD